MQKEWARTNYNRLSGIYDLLSSRYETCHRDFALCKLDVHPGETVVEIGYGTGHCIQTMAERVGPAGRVYGIDISQGMLEITQKRAKRAGVDDWVMLKLGDAVELPFESGSADAVFISFTLELFATEEMPRVLQECFRVLKDGGRLGIVTMAQRPNANWMTRLYGWMHARFPRLVDCRPIAARPLIEAAGFTIAQAYERSIATLPVDVFLATKPMYATG